MVNHPLLKSKILANGYIPSKTSNFRLDLPWLLNSKLECYAKYYLGNTIGIYRHIEILYEASLIMYQIIFLARSSRSPEGHRVAQDHLPNSYQILNMV
jgi:hypothetical protein